MAKFWLGEVSNASQHYIIVVSAFRCIIGIFIYYHIKGQGKGSEQNV